MRRAGQNTVGTFNLDMSAGDALAIASCNSNPGHHWNEATHSCDQIATEPKPALDLNLGTLATAIALANAKAKCLKGKGVWVKNACVSNGQSGSDSGGNGLLIAGGLGAAALLAYLALRK